MRVVFTLVAATLCLAGVIFADDFYYGTDDRIPVVTDSTKAMILFQEDVTPEDRQSILDRMDRTVNLIYDLQPVDGFAVCSLMTESGYLAFLDSLQAVEEMELVEPYFRLQSGSPLYIGRSFCVAFNNSITLSEIDRINANFGVSVQRELRGMPNVFVLLNSVSSGYRTLELANIYHSLPETRFAHPNFGYRAEKLEYKLFDYYHDNQPHVKKVIGSFNEASVWDFAGIDHEIVVAVIDDGIDAHEDLPANRILSGYDFADNTGDTRPGSELSHGMCCAGIIASSHTTDSVSGLQRSTGVISMDPNVLILPVNIFDDNGLMTTPDHIAEAVTFAYTHGADIVSCSWGWPDSAYDYPTVTTALAGAWAGGRVPGDTVNCPWRCGQQ